jgi:hypothetical protein
MMTCLDTTNLITDALYPDTHPFRSYEHFLLYYNQKDLTKVEDRLNAIAGIFCRLEMHMKCKFFEGLPTATLDAALLFEMIPSNSKNRLIDRRGAFPSYSWTGWSGIPSWSGIPDFNTSLVSVEESIANNKWLDSRTWIIWYSRSTDGSLILLRDHKALHDEPSTILTYRRRNDPPFPIPKSRTHLPTRPKIQLPPEKKRKYSLLQFWTVSALYSIRTVSPTTASIFDRLQRRCGYLLLDCDISTSATYSKFEVLILSESQECVPSAIESGLMEPLRTSAPTEDVDGRKEEWNFYWVMLIVCDGQIAERKGIGQVYQHSLEFCLDPGPMWREIVLG